jgi:predicted DNA-binding transcriptional regulator AlpA
MNHASPVNETQPSTLRATQSPGTLRAVFSELEAAAYTGLSTSNLRKGRMNGRRENYVEPPPYLKLGRRVVYLKADLDAWLMSHRVEV